MATVLRRVVAFTPVVTVTLLAVGAGIVGSRSGDDALPQARPPASSTPVPTSTPTSTPAPHPFVPVGHVAPPAQSRPAASTRVAAGSWSRGIDKLIHVASARYSWAVYYGADPEPLQSESGGFDLDPLQSNFDRTLYFDGKKHVVHVRRFGETTYMQFDHWGNWAGCWLRVTNDMVRRQTGVDLRRSLPLPVSVLAVTDAKITKPGGFWFGAPFHEYAGEVSAAEGLAFLGISGTVIHKDLDRLLAIKVPITVSLDASGQIHGGGARGAEVATAIRAAAPGLLKSMVSELSRVNAAFTLRGLGAPVAVPRPSPRAILPFNASRKDSCAAGGPRA